MGKFYIKPSLCFIISLKIFNIEYQQNEIPMQAHSTFGLKCSNAIFVPLKKNEYTYFFLFFISDIYDVMPFAKHEYFTGTFLLV